jgi:hypothetical protein
MPAPPPTGLNLSSNDEPTFADALRHDELVRQIAAALREADPPYVVGISGSWGSGKTSILRKLYAGFGGSEFAPERASQDDPHRKFAEVAENRFCKPDQRGKKREVLAVWFNPWHHQFEASPLVALLQEVHRHLSFSQKTTRALKKGIHVGSRTMLDLLPEFGKGLGMVLPSGSKVAEHGAAYEKERFQEALPSQRFRDYYEEAVRSVLAPNGRLILFIDDLDRCEAEATYRLLEALKLYLNARNCIYVLGMDTRHLEHSIARVLTGKPDCDPFLPLARSYLGKMLQLQFVLPAPASMDAFAQALLAGDAEGKLLELLRRKFGYTDTELGTLRRTLDANLPHNPRRFKAFVASWRLYLRALAETRTAAGFDWRHTIVLQYLALFEEQIYRKVEESPAFFEEVVAFVRTGLVRRYEFLGLELPTGMRGAPAGALRRPPVSATFPGEEEPGAPGSEPGAPAAPEGKADAPGAALTAARVLHVAPLVRELFLGGARPDTDWIERHLLGQPRQPAEGARP